MSDLNQLEDTLEDTISAIVAKCADYNPEVIDAILDENGITDEELREDIKETCKQVFEADELADENVDPLSIEDVDSLLDSHTRAAQQMADEDDTEVDVTEEDYDDDGDIDKVTLKKKSPENDGGDLYEMMLDDDLEDDEADDKPHDLDNSSQKNIIKTLSEFKY